MKTCPQCKEPMPALSKICAVCGYIETGESSQNVSLDDMLRQMETHSQTLKKGNLSLGNVINSLTWVVCIALAIQFAAMGILSESMPVGVVALLLFILFGFSLGRQLLGKTGAAKNSRECKHALVEFETIERQCRTYFGKDKSIRQQVDDISDEIRRANSGRRRNNFRQYLTGWIIIAVFDFAVGFVQYDFTKYLLDESDEQVLTQEKTVETSLKDANYEEAIQIFLTQDMGERGDYEKARLIVTGLLDKNKKSEAAAFVEQCASLRYPSDREKLQKLIN